MPEISHLGREKNFKKIVITIHSLFQEKIGNHLAIAKKTIAIAIKRSAIGHALTAGRVAVYCKGISDLLGDLYLPESSSFLLINYRIEISS